MFQLRLFVKILVVELTLSLHTQSNDPPGHHVLAYQGDITEVSTIQCTAGLCSRSAWVAQATNVCFWVTGKIVLGTKNFMVRNL